MVTSPPRAPAAAPSAPARRRRPPWRRLRAVLILFALWLLLGFGLTRAHVSATQRAHPPLGRFVEVDTLRQHVLERGAGRPVVFVHGAFGGVHDFAATILDEAAERYRCVAWDRPGSGYSERGDAKDVASQARVLIGLVRELDLERPLLVGFSFGGAVCLSAALQAPDAFEGLVLLNAPLYRWPDPLAVSYRLPDWPLVGPLWTETWLTPLGRLFARGGVERAFAPLPVPESFVDAPLALALRPDSFRANAEDVRGLKDSLAAQSERYAQLQLPITLFVSRGDRVVSPTHHAPRLLEVAPQCVVIELEPAGHQVLYAYGAEVLAAIDAHRRP